MLAAPFLFEKRATERIAPKEARQSLEESPPTTLTVVDAKATMNQQIPPLTTPPAEMLVSSAASAPFAVSPICETGTQAR